MDRPIERLKPVLVRAYERFRLKRWELVRSHHRSKPHQYDFGF